MGQEKAWSLVEPMEQSRPHMVPQGQNLVLMETIFSILLVTMILMAFCVYKPIGIDDSRASKCFQEYLGTE